MTETITLYLVLHAATRVIRRVSADAKIPLAADELLAAIPDILVIQTSTDGKTGVNTYWKIVDGIKVLATDEEVLSATFTAITALDGTRTYFKLDADNKKVEATADEVSQARVDPLVEALKRQVLDLAYEQSIDAVLADGSLPVSLFTYFKALQQTL